MGVCLLVQSLRRYSHFIASKMCHKCNVCWVLDLRCYHYADRNIRLERKGSVFALGILCRAEGNSSPFGSYYWALRCKTSFCLHAWAQGVAPGVAPNSVIVFSNE